MTFSIIASASSQEPLVYIASTEVSKPEAPQEKSGHSQIDPVMYIRQSALKYGVNPYVAEQVILCESGGDTTARGDHGTSYGAWQIHKPEKHHGITKECALDLECSTEYAMPLFKSHPEKWSCYRILKSKGRI